MIYIVIGVSGSGKTTVGRLLASILGVRHYDADDYHPPSNIKKMQLGKPLNDVDRLPWLQNLAIEIHQWSDGNGAVLSCSALKENYREILGSKSSAIRWIFLDGDRHVINARLKERKDHFFNIDLLDSQFRDLEIPDYAFRVSIEQSPEIIVGKILDELINE